MNGPLCRGLYAVLILFQGLIEANFFLYERFYL